MGVLEGVDLLCACFFFQAEDGIRDGRVTGVQTCALPISQRCTKVFTALAPTPEPMKSPSGHQIVCSPSRSEERRVGKECRSRLAPYPSKKLVNQVRPPPYDVLVLTTGRKFACRLRFICCR